MSEVEPIRRHRRDRQRNGYCYERAEDEPSAAGERASEATR
jgi:hypothetical protein